MFLEDYSWWIRPPNFYQFVYKWGFYAIFVKMLCDGKNKNRR